MTKKLLFIFIINFFFLTSCKSEGRLNRFNLDSILLDSLHAASHIVMDDEEGFLSKIQALDVSIQLKDNRYINEPNYSQLYKNFLQKEVSNFTKEDKLYLDEVLKRVDSILSKANIHFLPKFLLAKIKPNHYGNDVFYTRGDVIYLPESIFKNKNVPKVSSIIIHEIWHVLAEQYPKLKTTMYEKIGFEKSDAVVKIPPSLEKILLANPDGCDRSYVMTLPGGSQIIPLIKSNKSKYEPQEKVFFNYVKFDLYYVKGGVVQTNSKLESTVSNDHTALFFQNIKDNTQYIIHPDEIIADNFMLSLTANFKNDFSHFSKEGIVLLKDVLGEYERLR